jgi:hypothetical protein
MTRAGKLAGFGEIVRPFAMAMWGNSIATEEYRMRLGRQSVKLIEISNRIKGTYQAKIAR